MATGLITRVTLSRPDLVKDIESRIRNPRPMLEVIGVAGMASMHRQLVTKLSMDNAARTGKLTGALLPVEGGSGTDSVFDVTDFGVEVGTNLPYASQVNFGGRILPKTVKALAIPISDKLKRSRLWPRDIDPGRKVLRFIPSKSEGTVGNLVDDKGELGFGRGVLFTLRRFVDQTGKYFANWDEQAQRDIDRAFGMWWTGKLNG